MEKPKINQEGENNQPKTPEEHELAKKIAREQKTLETAREMYEKLDKLSKTTRGEMEDFKHNVKMAINDYDPYSKTNEEIFEDIRIAKEELKRTIDNIESGTIEAQSNTK